MQHRFYTNSERAWTAMLEEIQRARKSIVLESYIFSHDTALTHNFVEALAERARAGVTVKIVFDGFGSYDFGAEEQHILRDSGAELLFFTHIFRRIHRKVLVVDEQVGFVGGVNVGQKYVNWLDLHMRVTSPALIRGLLRSFSVSYEASGGTDPAILEYRKSTKRLRERAEMWLIEHSPVGGMRKLRSYYESRLSGAKKRITIVSPYFLPHRWFIRAIRAAVKRGVAVEVIMPSRTSPPLATIPNLFFIASMYEEGVRFFMMNNMNHAKLLLVDDEEGLLGSQNIDAQSFDFNAEVGVAFKQPEMITELRSIVEEWKGQSTEFTHDYFRRRWYHKPLEFVVRLLQPVM